ncbi:MAG: TetR/AcrR family transcriptional regulator [Microcella sp.]|uniref:TetR/AcrR family transcriptional regulator n=1 Tax=Microcella sp. TaxID=1913979 RepID=UPI0024C60D2F|nr:TetR/AcrR family transcriptional regulator [Microcella sp.]UYN82510.1 MAG: TetR/AcrR family transcriptional regulator [Microcella sp.]
MPLHDDLRAIALAEFATSGYAATSLQRIADLAGTSKASVLYHFASKELLLADIVSPALDDLETLLETIESAGGLRRSDFVERFVDLLLQHRQVVPLVINQGATLDDVPVMHRATLIMLRVAELFRLASSSTKDKLRFGVAFGGVAYTLAAAERLGLNGEIPIDEVRSALLEILHDLLVPADTTIR